MDWTAERDTWEPWTQQTHAYVAAINRFVATGLLKGWDEAGDQPEDPRTPELAEAVVDLVRRANAEGDFAGVRAHIATAHAPLIPTLENSAVGVRNVCWVSEEQVVASLGNPWHGLKAHLFGLDGSVEPLDGVELVGRTGDAYALVRPDGIEVRSGWSSAGQTVPRPQGHEGVPGEHPDWDPGYPESVIPLPDGSGAVWVGNQGVFLCEPGGVRRLYPTPDGMDADLASHAEYSPDDPYSARFDMVHAAVSPDGQRFAVGSQDSGHLLLDREGTVLGQFGPVYSEYPHHAAFHPEVPAAFFNSCHFYNGATVGILLEDLEGLHLDSYTEDERLMPIDQGCRAYDSTWLDDRLVLGDANGYARLRSIMGTDEGQHFVGSTVGGLDASPSGRLLAIGTYAGFLSLVDTAPDDAPDPAVIGTAGFRETMRYVCWDDAILRW